MKITKDYLKQIIKEELKKEGISDFFKRKPADKSNVQKPQQQIITHEDNKMYSNPYTKYYTKEAVQKLKEYFKVNDQKWVLDTTNIHINKINKYDHKTYHYNPSINFNYLDINNHVELRNNTNDKIRHEFRDLAEFFSYAKSEVLK